MKTLICGLLILVLYGFGYGQSCRPAELNYIVRDEKGNVMSETTLRRVFKEVKPPTSGVGAVSFAEDGKLVGYSGKEPKRTVSAIYFADAADCKLKVGEVVLTNGGDTMRLLFDIDIDRRSYTIDSLPFRRGTFRLDQKGLADTDQDDLVPATRWRKIK